MKVFTCAPEWEAMLTTIYDAWNSGYGHKNIRLATEPIGQTNLLDEYIHIEADSVKTEKVIRAIIGKISYEVYHALAITALGYEEDALDNIYRVLLLGFKFGPNVLEMVQYKDIMRNSEIRNRVSREANRFQEISRFNRIGNIYVSHIEPKSRIAEYLGPIFQDRMPSENFIIVDDIHKEACVHKMNQNFYMWKLSEEELNELLKTEESVDEYTDLWKIFFNTIAIKERENKKLQASMFPIWARKHAVEFN